MSGGGRRHRRSDFPSIAYRSKPASFDLTDFHDEHRPSVSYSKQTGIKSGPASDELLSTKEFVSAVGQIWNKVNPVVFVGDKEDINRQGSGRLNNAFLDNLGCEQDCRAPALDDDSKYFAIDTSTQNHINSRMQPELGLVKVTQKVAALELRSNTYVCPFFWQFVSGGASLSDESRSTEGLAKGNYKWMKEKISSVSEYPVSTSEIRDKNTSNADCTVGHSECCHSGDAIHPVNNLTHTSVSGVADSIASLSSDNSNVATNTAITNSLFSDYLLRSFQGCDVNTSVSQAPSSDLSVDDHIHSIVLQKSPHEAFQYNINDDKTQEDTIRNPPKFVSEEKNGKGIQPLACGRPHYALAKQEHAFAGAFAGIFVSLCLHPMDTIKTVIQSCRAEQKSIWYIGRSIVSERGVTGLYRGIASNIASSAPISAIYTFTYESVKGSLIPLFPKDYHSVAHCIAGGCASIATSFVFTPSERIKQQMQIGSHYNNCWKALVGIIGNGGLPSLYAGWGAVLCRNVPHSIIKFYTYESLKQLMLPQNSSDQPNISQTLVCGGVAGSTAALFTTPFDVVKTRLQTQIPGSTSRYNSVFHALQVIGKNEGLKGLYRGLTPRLVMYMSQGALFFASYESFKRLFSLGVPHLRAQSVKGENDTQDDLTPLELPS